MVRKEFTCGSIFTKISQMHLSQDLPLIKLVTFMAVDETSFSGLQEESLLSVGVNSVDGESFLSHKAARLGESPINSEAASVFFPKFNLAKNIFIISKMFTAFVVSKRTYKIKILAR